MKYPKDRIDTARDQLMRLCPPGTTVYTVLNSVSRSGMSRDIKMYVIVDGAPQWIAGYAAVLLGEKVTPRDGIKAGGCGMDMGFHLVYNLSMTLYPTGHGCTGEDCPSNDHSNGDRDRTPHGNGMTPHLRAVAIGADHWHREGGYALRHRWM